MIVKSEKNPIISKMGVCDPHIHIFGGKVYLYASHDCYDGTQSGDFDHMKDWEIWSSSDFVTWERESVIRPEDTPIGKTGYCWAVDAAEKNGKYYLYVSNHVWETYVLESDNPGKGFRAVRQTPLLPKGLTKTRSYDPGVFTDDDGESYIVFGTPVWAAGDSYYIAKLNPDMSSLAETPRKIQLDDLADDKPFIHKHNGIYYLSWASFYATADNIYGPYKFRGNIGLTHDHGSFFERDGQQYMAFTVNESLHQPRRATGIAYIHYRKNGEMVSDALIREYGVGQYNGRWNMIEAAWYTKGKNVEKTENAFGTFDAVISDGFIEFPNIYGLEDNPYLMIHCKALEDSEIKVYADGEFAGAVKREKAPEGFGVFSVYSEEKIPLSLKVGTHNIRIEASGRVCIDYIRFIT